MTWSVPGRATVAGINDLEAEGVQYASGAVYASAEVMGTGGPAGRVRVSDTENGLGVVLFVVEDQLTVTWPPDAESSWQASPRAQPSGSAENGR
jgi:hypothetical protein